MNLAKLAIGYLELYYITILGAIVKRFLEKIPFYLKKCLSILNVVVIIRNDKEEPFSFKNKVKIKKKVSQSFYAAFTGM